MQNTYLIYNDKELLTVNQEFLYFAAALHVFFCNLGQRTSFHLVQGYMSGYLEGLHLLYGINQPV
jgi:hypothetical protein